MTDYKQGSLALGGGGQISGEEEAECRQGQMYSSHARTTFTCILYIHCSFTNTPRVFMIYFPQKVPPYIVYTVSVCIYIFYTHTHIHV